MPSLGKLLGLGQLALAAALSVEPADAGQSPAPLSFEADASLPPELPGVRQVSFPEALNEALRQNPSVLQVFEELGRAEALVEEVRAPALPTLAFNGLFTQLDGDRRLGAAVIDPASQVNLNLTLSVPLIQPQRWAQWAHANDQVDIQRVTVAEARRQLATSVGHTYLSLLAQHNVIALDRQAIVTDRAHADYTALRFRGGFGTRIDQVRAEQQVQSDRAQLETALAQLVKLREALGVLLAADSAVDAGDAPDLGPTPELPAAIDEASRRPDVEVGRLRLQAAAHVAGDDYADWLPTLSGLGFPFYQAPPTATVPRWGWELQLVLTWQLYDGGLRYGLAHERNRLRREADLGLEGSARQAVSDVRAASLALSRAERALLDSRQAAVLAAQGLQLADLAYKAGAATNLEVVDAERVSRDAQTQVVVAQDSARQSLFDLLVGSGRLPLPQ